MKKQQVNVRVSDGTREKLDYLATRYGTQAEAFAVAVELLYGRDTAKEWALSDLLDELGRAGVSQAEIDALEAQVLELMSQPLQD